MGDVADSLINGDACETCGVYFEESGDGYPRKCGGCRQDQKKKGSKST